MSYGSLDIARLVFITLQNLSFATMIGALLSARWLKSPASGWQARVTQKLSSTFTLSAVVALLCGAAAFWLHCALMSEVSLQDAWPAVESMLETTRFGHAWAIGAVLMLCIVAISLGQGHGRAIALQPLMQPLMWLLIAGVALTRSNAGHPVDAGTLSLPVWADWVHLLAISSWVGIVFAAAFIVSPAMTRASSGDLLGGAFFVRAMSGAATAALILLFVTGAYNGWRGVNAAENILGSWYGQVLVFKLVLVLIAAALGGHNRFFEMPSLLASLHDSSDNKTRHLKRFGTVLHIESWVLAGVVAIAAVLVSSPLPGTE
jgi:putative copper resistance protein D